MFHLRINCFAEVVNINIYTIKLTKKHIVAAILAVAALVALVILFWPGAETRQTGGAVVIKAPEDCVSYLKDLGYETDPVSADTRTVRIPAEFDDVYRSYNEMQKTCGFDLEKYAGKRVELTTLRVTNWPDGEEVLADLLVYKKQVIGGAIYTASVDGFMQGLTPKS